jgi:hypothetical protein
MPFHITCVCGRLTVVPDQAAGDSVQCRNCGARLEVPQVEAPQPPPIPGDAAVEQPLIVTTDEPLQRRGHQSAHAQTIQLLAVALSVMALLSILPVAVAMRAPVAMPQATWLGGRLLEPWGLAAILVAILHLVYMLYLIQLQDYSCVRVVSLFWLLVASGYALLLAIRLLASQQNRFIDMLALDQNLFSSNQEALWCFLMTTLSGVLSYAAGRAATSWQRHA